MVIANFPQSQEKERKPRGLRSQGRETRDVTLMNFISREKEARSGGRAGQEGKAGGRRNLKKTAKFWRERKETKKGQTE